MATPRLKIAQLDPESLERLQAMEQELGACIVALQPHYPTAELTPEQLRKLQALEKELGCVLLAYQK